MAIIIKNPMLVLGKKSAFDIEVVANKSDFDIKKHKLGAICIETTQDIDNDELKVIFVNTIYDNDHAAFASNTLTFIVSNLASATKLTFDNDAFLFYNSFSVLKYYLVNRDGLQVFPDEFINEKIIANMYVLTEKGLLKFTTDKLPYFYFDNFNVQNAYDVMKTKSIKQYLSLSDTIEPTTDFVHTEEYSMSSVYADLKASNINQYFTLTEEAAIAVNGIPV